MSNKYYKVHKGIMSHLSMEFNYELKEGHCTEIFFMFLPPVMPVM